MHMIGGPRWKRWLLVYLPVAGMVVFSLFPFYYMAVTSFRPNRELYIPWTSPQFNPLWTLHPTLRHFIFLFTNTLFARWLYNTLFIAFMSTLISLACGVLAGYALARVRFPLAAPMGTGIFITYLVPPTLLFIPLSGIIFNFHLSDRPWALILTYPTFLIPFCTWLMMGYFRTIPRELEEVAEIDGASRWQAMTQIIFPLAIPGILSAGIFAFTLSWNEFLYALVFINSTAQKTVSVGVITELVRGDVFFYGPLMAGALLGSIPVAFIYSFFVEQYVSAMTGAVKG